MSRVKLILDVVEEMSNVAESLQSLSESLKTLVTAVGMDEESNLPTTEPSESPAPKVVEPVQEKQIALTEVRAILAEKSRSGKTAQVKELLVKHGAEKLSDIDPSEYKALLEDVEVL